MKKIILASAATAIMMASAPAFAANTDNDSFDINASVAKTCTMENINDIALGTIGVSTTAGSGALVITGTNSGSSNQVYVSCNDTNAMTVVSTNGGKLKTGPIPAGSDPVFTNELTYYGGAANYLNGLPGPGFVGAAGNGVPFLRGAIHKQVRFDVGLDGLAALANFGKRPIAGVYTDTITVTVTTS